eukprot:c43261_g1_i1 orf=84-2228(+)
MATAEFLHHHLLRPRLPFHLAESRYLPSCRSTFNGLPFSLKRSAANVSKRSFPTPSLRSVQCLKQEEQSVGAQIHREGTLSEEARDGSNTEAVEWVHKAAPDPMVEIDPVTVFRRIVAERRANIALARANEEASLSSQTTSAPPLVLRSRWPGKSAIGIAAALTLLAVAAALYFLKSRKGRNKATELTLTNGENSLKSSINGRRKLVKDTIKAPDTIITAMLLGAASVSRPKGHIGSTHDTPHAANGYTVESQFVEAEIDSNLIVNAVATEGLKTDLHGSPSFEQMSSSSSIDEDYPPSKAENLGVDVTEGPWFGQAADDNEKTAPADVKDVLVQSQGLQFSNETSIEQLVSEIPVGEVQFESPALTGVMDGEFFGEVVSVNVATVQVLEPNSGIVQVDNAMFEESQSKSVLAYSNTTLEKLEQISEQDLVTVMDGKSAHDDAISLEQNPVIGSCALDPSNMQSGETDSDSDSDAAETDSDSVSNENYDAEQYFTPDQADEVTSFEVSDSTNNFEAKAEGYLLGQASDSLGVRQEGNATNLLLDVEQTLEGIEIEVHEALHGVDLSANALQTGQTECDEELVSKTEEEPSIDGSVSLDLVNCQNLDAVAIISPSDAAVQASEEVSRQESMKALETAVPAIAIGVGTVGALFGVAGGLQVVGFAALASFISRDFFWAQNRESLWQELNGITDRQKLLDFLARRKIMRNEKEDTSL